RPAGAACVRSPSDLRSGRTPRACRDAPPLPHGHRCRCGMRGGLGNEAPPLFRSREGRKMNDTGVIDQFLSVFSTYIDSGFGLLGGEVGFLSSTLIVIDVTIAALFWAWGADEDVLQRLVKKTLY